MSFITKSCLDEIEIFSSKKDKKPLENNDLKSLISSCQKAEHAKNNILIEYGKRFVKILEDKNIPAYGSDASEIKKWVKKYSSDEFSLDSNNSDSFDRLLSLFKSISLILSPAGVDPGSLKTSTLKCFFSKYCLSKFIWVDLPTPSIPSNEIIFIYLNPNH